MSDDPAVLARRGGREGLSVALLEARNELLARWAHVAHADEKEAAPARGEEGASGALAAELEARESADSADPRHPFADEAARLAARAGWFQEWWLARHVQRARGEVADSASPRLPGIEPRAEGWLEAAVADDAEAIREYLGQTMEQTLDLLAHAEDDDAGLYFFRLAMQHDDRISEQLGHGLVALLPPPRAERPAVGVPAQRWRLGSEPAGGGGRAGFVPHGERWAHEVAVPEFEIDAQCVNWAQFAEFAEDGGYDRRECWSDAGWAWLQIDGRRAPRDVEQLAGSVLVSRAGQLLRAPLQQPAMQVTRHEAEAWCRWAGRRLPTEVEWELAAHVAARRGFAWGDVLEWVAGSARPYPGAEARVPPGTLDVILATTAAGPARAAGGAGGTGGVGDRLAAGSASGPATHARPSGPPGLSGLTGLQGVLARAASAGAGLSGDLAAAAAAPCAVLRGCTTATPARWRHAKARRFALPHEDRLRTGFRSCAL